MPKAKPAAETRYRVTEWHTASNISGSVKGEVTYFASQTDALKHYLELVDLLRKRQDDGLFGKEITGVEISRSLGWETVMSVGTPHGD